MRPNLHEHLANVAVAAAAEHLREGVGKALDAHLNVFRHPHLPPDVVVEHTTERHRQRYLHHVLHHVEALHLSALLGEFEIVRGSLDLPLV